MFHMVIGVHINNNRSIGVATDEVFHGLPHSGGLHGPGLELVD